MSRILIALLVVLLVASCGGGRKAPPRNLDNACSILNQRPDFRRAFRKAERRWGVPTHVQMATIYQESRYRGDARTPHKYVLGIIPMGRQSSAYGYGQAIDGTWDQYRRETGNRRAKRDRMRDAADFIGWYFTKSHERNGIPLTDARRQYIAYHEGHAGYARGSWKRKSWLLRVADDVASRSEMYRRQLARCN
ncbi:transglycosylase SLT domain-containing protein [Jhaorihella thermophila]|uniref:Transglycosylase SLT domain-containing protein n=1 Tax=Jhaorihella thermophila TaxID=488547 RepID=A0A1H5XB04_9RHOB|nr:lytic transglycosylase [Jhaorihella thermophila]SEG08630.1 hypothetical protein SAMN05421751_11072 [Jhaorihella thermophila]